MQWPGLFGSVATTLILCFAASSLAAPGAEGASDDTSSAFNYADVVALAEARAANPYNAPAEIPQFLKDFGFAELDRIGFQREQALWHEAGLPFEVMFFHPGSYFTHAVDVQRVDGGDAQPIPFDKNRFNYPDAALAERVPADLGYAGFKVLHELETPGKLDEVLSFLGATYFRALGEHQHYGLSARGLAIDTARDTGEEFPSFVGFWLVEPEAGDDTLTLFALMDSPSVAGAYRFTVTPGPTTVTEVETTLFTRKPIEKLGIAPLTSMYMWGENSLERLDDYRPEAHDSDGLLISSASGEWLWRPIYNPRTLVINQFSAGNVRGFGLMQRDRDFANYQDLEYHYQDRPSAWVVPKSDWGKGHLELVQIPSDSEVNDNIGLYWVPERPVAAGQRLHYDYDIRWTTDRQAPDSLAVAVASRIGRAAVLPGEPRDTLRVAIEFAGGPLEGLDQPGDVNPRVNAMRDATIDNIAAVHNPHTGGWRLTFLVPAASLEQPLELRAFLEGADGGALTETWSYALSP